MHEESIVTVVVAVVSAAGAWGVWVSVSVFKHAQEIALIKKEIQLMQEIKVVLEHIHKTLEANSE